MNILKKSRGPRSVSLACFVACFVAVSLRRYFFSRGPRSVSLGCLLSAPGEPPVSTHRRPVPPWSPGPCRRYAEWLGRGISVVTSNKKAGAGDLAFYRSVRAASAAAEWKCKK